MRAFVLAAGEGRRLRPLTDAVPKPMIEIAGRPLLEYNVRMLARFGITEIFVNLHHRAEVVRDYFGDGSAFGVRMTYSYEPELLGTAGALVPVRDALRERFLLLYGDNLTTCDLDRMRAAHPEGALATVALFERDDVSQSGVVAFAGGDEPDRIASFIEKPQPGQAPSHWVSAGIMLFEPSIFEFIPPRGPSDIGRDVLPAALAAGAHVHGYRMRERLWWIDSLEDYRRTNADPAVRALG